MKSKAKTPNLPFSSSSQVTQGYTRAQTRGSKTFAPCFSVVIESWVYTYIETHQIVSIKHMEFFLYINKAV